MELLLRAPRVRHHALQPRGFSGLGAGTCQWPQPGVPMVYPPCDSSLDADLRVAPTSRYSSVYDVPGLLLPPASQCLDAGGNAGADAGCVEANLAIERENFARTARFNSDPAFRSQFTGESPTVDMNPFRSPAAAPAPVPAAAPAPAVPVPANKTSKETGGALQVFETADGPNWLVIGLAAAAVYFFVMRKN